MAKKKKRGFTALSYSGLRMKNLFFEDIDQDQNQEHSANFSSNGQYCRSYSMLITDPDVRF